MTVLLSSLKDAYPVPNHDNSELATAIAPKIKDFLDNHIDRAPDEESCNRLVEKWRYFGYMMRLWAHTIANTNEHTAAYRFLPGVTEARRVENADRLKTFLKSTDWSVDVFFDRVRDTQLIIPFDPATFTRTASTILLRYQFGDALANTDPDKTKNSGYIKLIAKINEKVATMTSGTETEKTLYGEYLLSLLTHWLEVTNSTGAYTDIYVGLDKIDSFTAREFVKWKYTIQSGNTDEVKALIAEAGI